MRVALHRVPAPRIPRVPWWSVAIVAVWGALVAGTAWLESRGAPRLDLCMFHRATGRPCPTCGSTRAVFALVRGEPLQALLWNPLVVLSLAALAAVLVYRVVTGTRPALDVDRGASRLLWAVGLAAFALNWAWVWDRA